MEMTPYAIRLELLKMAKDILLEDYHAKREHQFQLHQVASLNAASTNSPQPMPEDLPPFLTEEDIISKATKLNAFVSNRS